MQNTAIQVQKLQGVYTALMTPMHAPEEGKIKGEVDYEKLDMLIEDQIAAGVQGILACGTTGQSATLDYDEHINLVERIFYRISGRVQLMASAGTNDTERAVHLTQGIERRIGPTTFLHVTGYYNNPPQEGLIAHFETIARHLVYPESNIVLYNVPGRTKSNIEAKTAIELAQHPKIIGVKEASGDLEQVKAIIEGTDPDQFRIISGEDNIVDKIVAMGGFGVISATANIGPAYFKRMVQTALGGNHEEAARMQEYIGPLVKAVFAAKNPIPLAHIFNTDVRLPLVKLPGLHECIMRKVMMYSPEELGISLADYHRVRV